MADTSESKSAAEIQREIEMQRHRVEDTIDQIQERLSPGQIVDELLTYTKSGGGEFVSNLTHAAMRNPLPVALLGVSLVWLIVKPGGNSSGRSMSDKDWDKRLRRNGGGAYAASEESSSYATSYGTSASYNPYEGEEEEEYPTATVQGSVLQRLGHVTDEGGNRYSEFVDDAGKKFRALTDTAGNRAGHFMDEAGNKFRGFTDAAGSGITQFRDEAGNLLHEASGWASQTWAMAKGGLQGAQGLMRSGMGGVRSGVSGLKSGASGLSNRATRVGGQVQNQADYAMRSMRNVLNEQPLVGGAIAFAVGAAIGSALPRTRQEDEFLGEASDNLKKEAGHRASELYEKGKEQVGTLYETAQDKASQLYGQAKETLEHAKEAIVPSTGQGEQPTNPVTYGSNV